MTEPSSPAAESYTQRRLKELGDEFSVMFERAGREEYSSGSMWQGKLETFLSTSIQQAKQEMAKELAEEIEKMSNDVYGHYEEFARQGFRRCKQRVLSSLQSL